MSKHDFDVIRACFYLIAFVIGAQVFAVLIAEITCLYNFRILLSDAKTCGEPGMLSELMSGALAAALAFAGSRITPSGEAKETKTDNQDDV